MKKRIIILNDDNHKIDEILKNMEVEISNIEIAETSIEDLNIIKNILYRNNKVVDCIIKKLELLGFSNDKIGQKYIVDAIFLWTRHQETNSFNISFIYKKYLERWEG